MITTVIAIYFVVLDWRILAMTVDQFAEPLIDSCLLSRRTTTQVSPRGHYRVIGVVGPCKSNVSRRPVGRIPFQSYS